MIASVLLALFTTAQEPSCPGELRIEPTSVIARAGTLLDLRLIVRNRGRQPITLVQPGDGSDIGWRTPIVTWSKVTDGQESPRQRWFGGRCGTINPLKPGEVFHLAPGEEKQLDPNWSKAPPVVEPGHHRFTVLYRNDPRHRWWAAPHDPAEWEKMLGSTPCALQAEVEVIGTVDER